MHFSLHRSWAMKARLLGLLSATAALAGSTAFAGVVLELEKKVGKENVRATVYLEGNKMRVEDKSAKGTAVMIFDGDQKKMYVLQTAEKKYTEMGETELKKMKEQLEQIRKQMAERIKTLPPDQRKKMEELMARNGLVNSPEKEQALRFEKMGKTKTYVGLSCEMYRIIEEDKPAEENCIVPWSSDVLMKKDLEGIESMRKLFANTLGGGRQRAGIWQIAQYPGFPVYRERKLPDGGKEIEELKSLSRKPIAPERFKVPAGYKKEARPIPEK